MSYVNVWMAIPEDDHNELNNGRNNGALSDVATRFSKGQMDAPAVQNMYLRRTSGPNTWVLWSMVLPGQDIVSQVNSFRQEFPGAQVLGCWKPDGAMLGCTLVLTMVPNPAYVGEPERIPHPSGEGTIRNPAWVPEEIEQRTQEGDPVYDQGDLTPYFVDGIIVDLHRPAGWQPKVFA